MALRVGWSAGTAVTDMEMSILLPLLFAAFVLLVTTRALAIHLSRRSNNADEVVAGVARLDFVPLNTPGEAIKSVKSFWRMFATKPGSPLGLLAGVHLLLWLTLIATVIIGIAMTSNF